MSVSSPPSRPFVDGATLTESTDVNDALALVDAVPPSDDALERDRILIRHLIEGRAESAARTTRPGHLTGSAFVVDSTATHALLLFHTKLQRWLQPGGHADGDMNLVNVAWREATEESGIEGLMIDPAPIDLDIHRVAPPKEDAHLHLDVRFLVVAPFGAQPVANDESQAMLWVAEADLATYDLDPGLRRMAVAGFARARALLAR